MDRIGQTYSVLTVSAADKFSASLRTLLPEEQYDPVRAVRDAASARRLLLEQSLDIVIVNAPLPDEFGTQLALELSETSGAGVLLLVTVLAFNIVGDGLRDAFDPKMKR